MNVCSDRKSAFTLIETLVVLLIIAIVVAITIPAVVSARESARRVQCVNNLKSIALAINSHLGQKNCYPWADADYSIFIPMLPYLEQGAVYQSLNLTEMGHSGLMANDVNFSVFCTKLSVFICPSNLTMIPRYGPTSYAGNVGWGVGRFGGPDNGVFENTSALGIDDASIRDGLANTVAVSEFCNTSGMATPQNARAVFELGRYGLNQFDTMVSDCLNVNIDQQAIAWIFRGKSWASSHMFDTMYDHNLPPNQHVCFANGSSIPGAWTASSYHPGGVNCAYLDGHVSFVRDTISISTWRGLATMAGGEVISGNPD